MSYTELFKVKSDGNAESFNEVRNAFRGAMAVWNSLEKKYLPETPFSRLFGSEAQKVWDLVKDERLTSEERICMASTFDNVMVKRENLPKLIVAFRKFPSETSLPEQADLIEMEMNLDEDLVAIGWNQTSVNGDTWANFGGYDEEEGEPIPYNINTMDRHWFLFDEYKF